MGEERAVGGGVQHGFQPAGVIVVAMREDDSLGGGQIHSKAAGVGHDEAGLPGIKEDRSAAAFDQERQAVFPGQMGETAASLTRQVMRRV